MASLLSYGVGVSMQASRIHYMNASFMVRIVSSPISKRVMRVSSSSSSNSIKASSSKAMLRERRDQGTWRIICDDHHREIGSSGSCYTHSSTTMVN